MYCFADYIQLPIIKGIYAMENIPEYLGNTMTKWSNFICNGVN